MFGTVSNADYLELLQEARILTEAERRAWLAHVAARRVDRGGSLMSRQYEALAAGRPSIDQRIAAMHALLRAYGAEFRRTEPDNANPWGLRPDVGPAAVGFVYRLRLDRLGDWRLIRRWVRLDGTFAVRDLQPGLERARGSKSNSLILSVTGTGTTPQLRSPPRSGFHDCPPVPPSHWQRLHALTSETPIAAATADSASAQSAYRNVLRLAENFLDRGRIRLALPHLERGLMLAETLHPDGNETVAVILDRLAAAYRAVGQPLRASEYDGRAADIRIRAAEGTTEP